MVRVFSNKPKNKMNMYKLKSFQDDVYPAIVRPRFISANIKVLDWSKVKAFAHNKINVTEQLEFVFGMGRDHCEKRRK